MQPCDLSLPMGVGQAKALAAKARTDAALRRTLLCTAVADDGRRSRNAAWALTHLAATDAHLLVDHRTPLADLAIATADTSLRRMAMTLLVHMEWTIDDIRTDLLDCCLLRLADPAEPYGVRALCAKLAWAQCRHYAELRAELQQTLTLIEPHTIGPGLRNTRSKVLKAIQSTQ